MDVLTQDGLRVDADVSAEPGIQHRVDDDGDVVLADAGNAPPRMPGDVSV
jgi:hypothetical protein